MRFDDEVRSSYRQKAPAPKRSIAELRNECARILVSDAKERLMLSAKAGDVQELSVGFWGRKVKAVCCTYSIKIYSYLEVSVRHNYKEYGQEPDVIEGYNVPNESEAKAVFNIIQQICNRERINVERFLRYKSTAKTNIRFWIEI